MKHYILKSCIIALGLVTETTMILADTTEQTFSYQINLVDENSNIIKTLLTDDEAYTGKSIKYSYPKYLTDSEGNVTYVCTTSTFTSEASATEGGTTNVLYQKYDGVARFFEAEDLNLSTNAKKDVSNKNCSSGSAIKYINTNSPIYTVDDNGIYSMTLAVATGNAGTNSDGTPKKVSFTVNQDDNQLLFIDDVTWSANDTQKKGNIKNDNLVLEKGKSILLTTSPAKNAILDYVLIEKTASRVSVSAAKYATWVAKDNVIIPEEVKVYAIKENEGGTGIIKTEIQTGTVIPAGMAILVGGEEGNHDFAVTADDGQQISDNRLLASDGTVVSDGNTYYALSMFGGKVGFALVGQGVTIPEGKAYLKVDNQSGAKFISMDGEITGINNTSLESDTKQNTYYTLEGKKTKEPSYGLFIHNGKKVIVKK